ncbi:MAG: hypothetical protein GVY25_00705 [Bacteroidetes bacterium]|jgi:hypothetical protein|nr:hypothetical protein [Bacteroidota bacterium]
MDRCIWSHETSDDVMEITVNVPDRLGRNPKPETLTVLPQYEEEVRAYADEVSRHGTRMLILTLGLSVLLVLASVLPAAGWGRLTLPVAGLLTAAIGGVLIRYPFATPETIKMMGMRRARTVVRWIAGFTVLLGLGLAATGVHVAAAGA